MNVLAFTFTAAFGVDQLDVDVVDAIGVVQFFDLVDVAGAQLVFAVLFRKSCKEGL